MAGTSNLTRPIVQTLIAALCVAALLLIVTILNGSGLNQTAGRSIGTAVAFSFFGLTGVSGLFLLERRPGLGAVALPTVALSAIAFVLISVAIWSPQHEHGWHAAVYAGILAAATSQASLLLATARPTEVESIRLVRAGTILAVGLLAALTIVAISSPGRDVGAKPIGVVAVLYLLGNILLPLMRRSGVDRPPGDGAAVDLLRRHGMVMVEGPVSRVGQHGPGRSVCLREPDGTLVEVISYEAR